MKNLSEALSDWNSPPKTFWLNLEGKQYVPLYIQWKFGKHTKAENIEQKQVKLTEIED